MKHSVIFSADYDFQVLSFINGNSDKAWETANELASNGTFERYKVEHYDVASFPNYIEMNEWIMDQVMESRKSK